MFEFLRIDSWICTAIKRNAVALDLCIETLPVKAFELPRSLFLCKTLQILKLQSTFIINPPTSNCFPSLKFLYVLVYRPSDGSLQKLLSFFPVLETLTIKGFVDDYDKEDLDINVSAPELKKLDIDLGIDNVDNEYKFSVNAPKLEFLNLCLDALLNCSLLINQNSLVKANIDLQFGREELVYERGSGGSGGSDRSDSSDKYIPNLELQYIEQHQHAIAILKDISNVKYLSLSARNLKGDLPAFENLNKLKLVSNDCCYWGFLTKLLERSPNLEYLIFEHDYCSICEKKDFRHDEFNPPESVPICLLTRLKAITFNKFHARKDEMEVAKYLLKHGEVLNKITISTMGISGQTYAYKKALFEELLACQRGSKTCHVEFL